MSNLRQLHTIFSPSNYDIKLALQRVERTFSGVVRITGHAPRQTEELVVHAKDLAITSVTVDGHDVTSNPSIFDELIIKGTTPFAAGTHIIEFRFSGAITDPMNGLYPCYFTLDGHAEELLATQFESHHAREVFPCIDEPGAKATFDLELTTEPGITVIANAPVKSQAEQDGKLITSFSTTPVMSTYLLAWVAGKLAYKEAKTKDGVIVRSYSTPDKVAQTAFSLEVATHTIEFFDEYFATPYPLPKFDMIALPDFSSGAMENWGCTTFRETALLLDPQNYSPASRQYVASVVAHELAHQWFGNLVTMEWWNDLWLNESFATWISYLANDHQFPEWQLWTQFYDEETVSALDRDGLANVQKVQQEVNDPEEIRTLFDPAIVYAKGASLLHMLHNYVGATAFQEGLRIYLARHAYKNARTNDLWHALAEASGKDVAAFMDPWLAQAGHPMVSAGVAGQQVVLHQQRFYNNPKEGLGHDPHVWPLPLLAGDALDAELLDAPGASLAIAPGDDPLLLNRGRSGFYLTAYNADHLARLATAVRAGRIGEIDRLGLLSDAVDLARAGQATTLDMLKLLEAYQQEASEPVWGAIADCLGVLKLFANNNGALRPAELQFVADTARTQFERLGWEPKDGESYFDQLLRPTIIALMCYSEDKSVVAHAMQLFEQADKPEDIRSDIRASVGAIAARFGGAQAFEKLLGWYRTTTSAQIRIQVTASLSNVHEPAQTQELLALLATKEVKLQDLFYWFVYLMRKPQNRAATWQWMKDNWDWITKNFGSDMHYNDFPEYAAGSFSSPAELSEYKAFFTPKLNHPALGRAIKQGAESIEARILWLQRDEASVAAYLQSR